MTLRSTLLTTTRDILDCETGVRSPRDRRWLANLGEPPRPAVLANRNQLIRVDARTESDSCDAFVQCEPGAGDCWSDGHYLCMECSRMSLDSLDERREWAPGEMTK